MPDIEEKGDAELSAFLANSLKDYFHSKKSRLKVFFWSEVFRKHPILGRFSIGTLVEEAGNGRSGTMKCDAMKLLSEILKPVTSAKRRKRGEDPKPLAKAFEEHVESLGAVVLSTIQSPLQKRIHRNFELSFWIDCIDALGVLFPQKTLHSVVDTAALLAGLKAMNIPSQGKSHDLYKKLVETVTAELAKNAVSIQTTTNVDDNKTPSKMKEAEDGEVPMEIAKDETPSSQKKTEDGEVPMEVEKDETPS